MPDRMKYRVVIVETQEKIQKLLVASFKRLDLECIVFEEAGKALKVIDEINNNVDRNHSPIGLVLSDIFLKDMTGFEFCEHIRLKYSLFQLPFVLKFVDQSQYYIHHGLGIGCNDFIQIPFDYADFANRISNLINVKRLFEKNKRLLNVINTRSQVFQANIHDLKNPLSSIFSLSGMSMDSFKNQEDIIQTFRVIHNASKMMLNLVNETLEYIMMSNEEDTHFANELIDIVSLCKQVVEISIPLANKKQQQIITSYTDKDCFILSDTNKIYHAINNIVGNAIKFSEFKKRIWVTVDRTEDKIKITIKDEGPGFSSDEANEVFVKFGKHSATPTGDEISTGLGLLITKQIINRSAGEIYLESELGKGATFVIEFTPAPK